MSSTNQNYEAFRHQPGRVSLDQLLDLGCNFTSFREISAEVSTLWRPLPYQSFVDWMDENFYLSAESSATEGRWKTLPFQRGPTFAMADPRIKTYGEQKPAQKGASKRLTGYVGYAASRLRRNVIVYQPTKDDASDYANTQFLSMLKTCPAVAKTLRSSDPEKIDRDNTQKRRVFEGAIVYIRAGNTGTNFRRITGDDIIFDDLDGAAKSVRGASTKKEGSVRVKMEGRANASRRPKFIYISTPTKSGTSLIEDIGRSITEHFRRWFPCPFEDCNKPFQFEFGMLTLTHLNKRERELTRPTHGLLWDFDLEAERAQVAATAHYRCPHCARRFEQSSMKWMDRNGWWQSDTYKQRDSDGEFTDLEGNRCDPPTEVFYQYSGIISYDQPWANLVDKWLRAKEALDRGDDDDIIGFYNEDMGMVWVPPNMSEFKIDELLGRLAEYPRTPINNRIQRITWSCDVQGAGYFDWELVGWAPGQESWSIDTGMVLGDPTDKNCRSWSELHEMAQEQFRREDGRMLSIDLCFMDARFQPDNVKRWCARAPHQRMAAQGQTNPYAQIVKIKTPGKNDHRCFTAQIGVHKCSEKLYRMLAILPPVDHQPGQPVYGMCHFPFRSPYYDIGPDGQLESEYFKQLTAEKRVEFQDKNGQLDFRYVKDEGVKNEKHDCRKMNIAAIETVEVFYRRPLVEPVPQIQIASADALAQLEAMANQ